MNSLIAQVIGGLFGVLKTIIGPLLAYFQGKKVAKLEGKEEALEDAKEDLKAKHEISQLDDDDLANIVFFDDERGNE